MRANGALQVLGFFLSLARGSEVGNSQAGKWHEGTRSLGTRDPNRVRRILEGRGSGWGGARLGGAHPGSAGTT